VFVSGVVSLGQGGSSEPFTDPLVLPTIFLPKFLFPDIPLADWVDNIFFADI
jgi:hypothetical protein